MGIARSTCYRASRGSADDTALVEAMHAIKDEFEAYGWRRMQAALRHRGWIVNHKKIKRLMREHAMHPPRRRRFVATMDSNHDEPVFPDRSAARGMSADSALARRCAAPGARSGPRPQGMAAIMKREGGGLPMRTEVGIRREATSGLLLLQLLYVRDIESVVLERRTGEYVLACRRVGVLEPGTGARWAARALLPAAIAASGVSWVSTRSISTSSGAGSLIWRKSHAGPLRDCGKRPESPVAASTRCDAGSTASPDCSPAK